MLKKRIIISLTFMDGILYRTKNFIPDYRYTKEFINLWNIDELILIDVSTIKFQKEFLEIVKFFSNNCFVPISIAGGIKSISDARYYFDNGADKIICNLSSFRNEDILNDISNIYGNQSVIGSIDFKTNYLGKFEIFEKSGQEMVKKNINELINNLNYENFGEVLLNDISRDGGMLGFDIKTINQIVKKIKSPAIVIGGGGNWSHFFDLFNETKVSAACTQNIYHFTEESIKSLKIFLKDKKISIRE